MSKLFNEISNENNFSNIKMLKIMEIKSEKTKIQFN
jgi:hypothetical protein